MADYIPFITSEDTCNLCSRLYGDAAIIRVSAHHADRFLQGQWPSSRVWIDPSVDGIDTLRGGTNQQGNSWSGYIASFANYKKIADPGYYAKPAGAEVYAFVKGVMDKCAGYRPAWITVPQIPIVGSSSRNKINRELAIAAGKWKSATTSSVRLILPLLFTHQEQLNKKTARNPRVDQAERCYHAARADGFWVVDRTLTDDSGSTTLRDKRFPGIIGLHEELNDRIPSKIRIAGPYWGLNLVLWARGLVDHPAIGIGTGYQYFAAGSIARQPAARVALPSLRRRVGISPELRMWLDAAAAKLGPSHPAYSEYSSIRRQFSLLSARERAKEQVATFYKHWYSTIAAAPKGGRSMALFQDLSAAYTLGKALPDLVGENARDPEAVAESLMLICL